jgi:hypothetical protein
LKNNKKMKLNEFREWIHKVKIEKVKEAVYLHVKKNNWYEDPIRILSNSRNVDTEEYKNRWEIETIFKTMKQEYEMEKIQAWNLQILNNIVSIIMLAVAFAKDMYDVSSWFKWTTFFQCGKMFTNRFQKYARHQWLTMNKNSIIWFISTIIQWMYKNKRKWNKKWTNRNTWIKAQLKLFSMNDLQKTGSF